MEHTISWRTIFRVGLTAISVYVCLKLISVILVILISIMLAAAFSPVVEFLKKFLPTPIAAIIVILLLLSPIALIAFNVVPNLIEQFPTIIGTVDSILKKTTILPPLLRNIDLTQYTSNIGSYLLRSTSVITNFLTTFITIIFLTLYFLIDSKKLLKLFYDFAPKGYEQKVRNIFLTISQINGQYIRGNLIISVICGLVIYTGLSLLNIPFAASLALFAALTDLLPLVGAFIGAAPAIIIGFSISPTIGLFVLALFIIYQQVENNLLSPNIYTKALDLSPALSFMSVIIGGALFGMFGAFIALPIAASIPTLIRFLKENRINP